MFKQNVPLSPISRDGKKKKKHSKPPNLNIKKYNIKLFENSK